MEFEEVLGRRRMVRHYLDRAVERSTIERIVARARKAPSAGFAQGCHFVVVTEAGTRAEIAALAGEEEYVAKGLDPWISAAPVHVVVCIREASYHERYAEPDKLDPGGTEMEWPIPYWWVDAGAALMLLLLAAVDEGLGAGFFGTHRIGGLNSLLQIPSDVVPIGVVTLGHPAPDQPLGSASRGWKSLDDVVRWGRW